MDSLLKYALSYAQRGWPVFPCSPDNKRPLIKDGFKAASADPGQIRSWWAEWPNAMIGLPTGAPIGAFVVDLDPKDGEWVNNLEVGLAAELGIDLSDWAQLRGPAVMTPRGGRHIYFAMPADEVIGNRADMVKNMTAKGQIDLRGTGGYVIAAPSVRFGLKALDEGCDGKAYEIDPPARYADLMSPPAAPAVLIDLILRRGRWEDAPKPQEGKAAVFRGTMEGGPNDDARAQAVRRYVLSAVDNEIEALRAAGDGTRNHTLNIAALRLGHFVGAGALDEAVAVSMLEGVARGWPEFKKSQGTIRSGLTAGKKDPTDLSGVGTRAGPQGGGGRNRPPPPDDRDRPEAPGGEPSGASHIAREHGSFGNGGGGSGGGGDQDGGEGRGIDPETLQACAREPQNDLGNARRLLAWFGSKMLVVRGVGPHAWAKTHWKPDGGEEAFQRWAQDTSERIALESRTVQPTKKEADAIAARDDFLAAKGDEELTAQERDLVIKGDRAEAAVSKRKGDRRKFSISSGNNSRLSAMVSQAAPHITVAPEDMDADPMAINCQNGTLRLIREDDSDCPDPDVRRDRWAVRLDAHDPADRIAKILTAAYDPEADCPKWLEFMRRFQPNQEIRRFLRAWHGYALTGMTGEQAFVFNYGLGANGKSTFMEALARIQGNYAQTLPAEALTGEMQRRGDQATPELARLTGARLVRCAELPRGQPFRESTLKMLTGGEKILVRNLHEKFFEMSPVFKAIGSGNDRPPIGGVDEGIWRRMRLVPWSVRIPENERRPMEKILSEFAAEGSGILNWLIGGLLDYMENGLIVPDEIRSATDDYRDEMDPVGSFCDNCVLSEEGSQVTARDMYEAYVAWCNANAVKPFTEKTFPSIMKQKGFEKKDARIRVYLNVRLIDVPADPKATPEYCDPQF